MAGNATNLTLPAIGSEDPEDYGNAEIAAVHDWLANHPNTAPFISYRLIQRLVTSNPSSQYVHRVADKFTSTGGDLREVTRAILLDHEARTLEFVDDSDYGKMKEPLVRYIQALRGLNGATGLEVGGNGSADSGLNNFNYPPAQLNNLLGTIDYSEDLITGTNHPPTHFRYPETDDQLAQTPWRAPTVFNWFLPDFAPVEPPFTVTDLVAPEFQITTETTAISAINYFYQLTVPLSGQVLNALGTTSNYNTAAQESVGFSNTDQRVVTDVAAWIDKYNAYSGDEAARDLALVDELDLLLTAGNLQRYPIDPSDDGSGSDDFRNPRELISQYIALFSHTSASGVGGKVRSAFYLMTSTPEYVIQK